ncbi:hypothetical protein [Accumulibacter sp.]|uniref:hypothetical protein n=1 Tax=Accumulibacter sp. TaxID=2053492 RepID=UPI00260C8B77|nr:hypothetical protein [Accumulibacter sp.]
MSWLDNRSALCRDHGRRSSPPDRTAGNWRPLLASVALGALSLMASAVLAQDVFVTRGSGGSPVYSDQAPPGAKPISLPPLNVIAPTPVVKGAPPHGQPSGETAGPLPASPAYRSFAIVFPEDGGSVAANSAIFEVRVAVEPPLQLGEGHAILVRVNGRPVGERFTASEFMIPPEFWGDTLPSPNQRYQLDAAVVDRQGTVLARAVPVVFQLRYVGRFHRPPHQRPMPIPVPLPPRPERATPPPVLELEKTSPGKGAESLRLLDR